MTAIELSSSRLADPYSSDFGNRFGDQLVRSGLLDRLAFQRAINASVSSGERFDHVLTKLGLISERDIATQLSDFLRIPMAAAEQAPEAPVMPELIGAEFVHRQRIMPIGLSHDRLSIITSDPFNIEPLRALAYLADRHIDMFLTAPAEFEELFSRVYHADDVHRPNLSDGEGAEIASEIDLQRLQDLASEAPTIRLVNQLIGKAVEQHASDIHIEPSPDALTVRYRIDGALMVAQTLPPHVMAGIISRIKIMSKLDIAERRRPQDGRVKIAVRGVDIDFRVSTIPTLFGESVVMRILDRRSIELDFQKLGFAPVTIQSLRSLMHEPNGIVLVTGPTGSGKTTTLYTALKEIVRPELKVFTVEDPIEYQLAGVNQVQVQPGIGLTFPQVLRSILRQDPDVIMIGEIRDLETAQIAIQASLTGHLVFSTLHTNSAASSITRLLDMGIEEYLLASTVKGVLAQRLVRRLCADCAADDPAADVWIRTISSTDQASVSFKVPRGCSACANVGYRGRSTISELLIVDDEIQAKIHARVSDSDLQETARARGFRLLYEDGLRKASKGETSMEEVLRASRAG